MISRSNCATAAITLNDRRPVLVDVSRAGPRTFSAAPSADRRRSISTRLATERGETVELGNDQIIIFADIVDRCFKLRPLRVDRGQLFTEDLFATGSFQFVDLRFKPGGLVER